MNSDEAFKLLHAYVDGELDTARSLELEAHLAANPALLAACERLRAMSAAIRGKADYFAAPDALVARLRASVPVAPEEILRRAVARGWLKPAVSLAVVALVTWMIAAAWFRPGADERMAREVLAGHVRATLAGRLYDVASSDQHTVKPWLSARLAFSPPVSDFSAQGFELAGGRVDYVDGQPVAVLVYRRRQHVIDVFVRPGDGSQSGRTVTLDGFNIERFARNGMNFWMVSDLNRNELGDFAALVAEHSAAP
jgi:anti-sigma factor RsiW